MKKIIFSGKLNALLFVLLFSLTMQSVFSQEATPFSINESPLPAPTGFVNDYAGVIDAGTKQRLEQRLKEFKEQTNPPIEIAVAIVKTTGDRPIFDYSLAVARGWKIGSKEDDNPGALLFIAIDDRKYFTQISRNLEDELPDGLVGQMQRQNLVPAFRQGNYAKGVEDTVNAYIERIKAKQSGLATPTPETETTGTQKSGGISLCNVAICLIILFVLMIIFFSRSSKGKNDRDRWGGGGGFGGGGSALPWIIGSIIANSGSSGGWNSGGSSDWGGSSGGSDWGGFGGGGDFGGGGAGGDW